jgi:HD-GYP domain-containing protein (c-di-GMP phosphodiesterase class II)
VDARVSEDRDVAAVEPRAADDEAAVRRLNAAYQQSLRYAKDVRRLYVQLQRGVYQSLLGLANALEAKDVYTRGHSNRVSRWSRRLATTLDFDAHEVDVVAQAGLLHDLGKIGVPEIVLRKPGALDADEWELMRRHPLVGAEIVAPLEFFGDGALVIRHHHERMDGSGYPDGLRGHEIPPGARVVAVADVFDALTSDRPYRKAMSVTAALDQLAREAGRTLDEAAVAALIGLVRADAAAG